MIWIFIRPKGDLSYLPDSNVRLDKAAVRKTQSVLVWT